MNIKSLCVTINFAKKQVKPCNESEMKYVTYYNWRYNNKRQQLELNAIKIWHRLTYNGYRSYRMKRMWEKSDKHFIMWI